MCKPDNGNSGTAVAFQGDPPGRVVNSNVDADDALTPTKNDHNVNESAHIIQDQTIRQKLFQAKEDRAYVHKILGFSVLASYAYRFAHLGARDGSFFGLQALLFVVHHASLNLSSFVFHIPQRRIRGGFRIWPEYRIHSLVFCLRNLLCILRLWLLQQPALVGTTMHAMLENGVVNWMLVLLTCAGADYGSARSRHYQSNTVRGTDYIDPYANWFASEMQFQLTAICLSGAYQRYSLHIVGAFVIQFNSFLMTLRRKNVFSHLALTTTYGILLLGSMLVGIWEDDFTNNHINTIATIANGSVMLRMGLGVDKYVVWTVTAAVMYVVEHMPAMTLSSTSSLVYWTLAFWMTKFACFGMGLRKRSRILQQRQQVLAETKGKQPNSKRSNNNGNLIVVVAGVALTSLAVYDAVYVWLEVRSSA